MCRRGWRSSLVASSALAKQASAVAPLTSASVQAAGGWSERAPGDTTLVDILRQRARDQADRVGFTWLDGGEAIGGQLTYGQLERRARAIAATLQQRVGVDAVQAPPGPLAVRGRPAVRRRLLRLLVLQRGRGPGVSARPLPTAAQPRAPAGHRSRRAALGHPHHGCDHRAARRTEARPGGGARRDRVDRHRCDRRIRGRRLGGHDRRAVGPGDAAVHLGLHRRTQGRDGEPQQPPLQRGDDPPGLRDPPGLGGRGVAAPLPTTWG